MDTTCLIKERFDVREGDTLPFTGFKRSTREDLALLFAELKFTIGAEIGVCSGEFSEVLLKANPELKLLCVDPWTGYLSPWDYQVSARRAEVRYNTTKTRLALYKNVQFIRKTSMEAVKKVADKSLDFVYIDGLHDFDNAMMDVIHWTKKVKIGGIVSGHDYRKMYGGDVPAVVDAYTRAHQISEWYITTKEKACSFFWVNG